MAIVVFGVLAVALVASAYALAREVRLRKALQKLLQLILSRWRTHVSKTQSHDVDSVDRTIRRDTRL
jgi:hypothetical protein